MSLLKKLSNLFAHSSESDKNARWISVRCSRCGETIRARLNLYNDLTPDFGEGGTTYFCRKVLMGEGRCFQRVEVELAFDANRRLINKEISGGKFIDDLEH